MMLSSWRRGALCCLVSIVSWLIQLGMEKVQFYELVFGTWLAFPFLVFLWERAMNVRHLEWKYVLITFLGSSFYLINHYFMVANFWIYLINGYSLVFMVVYYMVLVRHVMWQSALSKLLATFSSIPFTIAYISFEHIARFIVTRGYNEFWVMLISYFGFLWIILWRREGSGDVSVEQHKQA